MAYLSDDELLDTEGGFAGWDDGTGAGAEETLEQALGSRVVRVHRNALAMAVRIAGLEKTADGRVSLVFDEIPDRLEVSRRHLPAIRRFIQAA